MKAISVQQPWASIICSGLKDVENRGTKLSTFPVRVLIHTGAKTQGYTEETMPLCWYNPIENYQNMGVLPDLKDFPKSAIIGVATIVGCVEDSESVWAQPGFQHWIIKDARLFKEPILGVKGKLGFFDVPGIDEDNLPEFMDIPQIERNGTHLRIPLDAEYYDLLETGGTETVYFNLTDENLHLFADDDVEPLPTETVEFVCGDRSTGVLKLAEYAVEPVFDEEEIATYTDAFEREYDWIRVYITPQR